MFDADLTHGLYENLITNSLKERIERIRSKFEIEEAQIDTEEADSALSLHLAKLISSSLESIKGLNRSQKQAEFCNQLLDVIGKNDKTFPVDAEKIVSDVMYLLRIQDKTKKTLLRPETPLSNAALFTGTSSDVTLESELKREILTSNRIDIICSFIKWSGLRLLLPELREFTKNESAQLRIITTSYLGATDLKAVETLRQLPRTKLLVSYDTKRTRLHAKSYIFYRNSGFGSAYIGSSNISNPALTSGLEWNLKVSQFESPHIWNKVCATFETYQNSNEFSLYDESSKERLKNALETERCGGDVETCEYMSFMDVHPYVYQEEILDKLRAEREIHKRNKNLVVAATGTGKTVIAAFDYKRILQSLGSAKFLFIAHREEILKQARFTFRNILRDQNFGELLVGGEKAQSFDELFVSIQSFNSQNLAEKLPSDFYDYIIIDEFHHAAAKSYQDLLSHFNPKYLLALTATPERRDGLNILSYFENHISAEIRLPDAINRKLLAPFQYFGISDNVDISSVSWRNGGYDVKELNMLYVNNINRANLVLQKMYEIILNVSKCRAICFCVSREHAKFMNQFFSEHNVRSECLTSDSSEDIRNSVHKRLVQRDINVVCVVDIYNEGVDIPEVDTVLFLRPTESLTVYLQQLGRGLRLCEDKECLTVLDFVGNANKNFNFESRFRAMMGKSSSSISDEVKNGFLHLPAGCYIELEKEAQNRILENINSSIVQGRKAFIVDHIRTFEDESGISLTLSNFLKFYNLSIETIYARALFSRMKQAAGIIEDFSAPDEERLRKGLLRIVHMNSATQIQMLLQILEADSERINTLTQDETKILTMLHFSLWNDTVISSLPESIERMKVNGPFFSELIEVLHYLLDNVDIVTSKQLLPFNTPLELHANYTRDEILSALGYWQIGRRPDVREGVKYIPDINADVFFVTLNKSEKHYSPTTMYLDYAVSDKVFHWQSQSTTSVESKTGQRYINNESTKLLFVREDKSVNGQGAPYCFLGAVDCMSYEGTRPINFSWKLREKMPARLCRITERMAE